MNAEMNAAKVLENVNACIEEMETSFSAERMTWMRGHWVFKIDAVYDELSIFDWWHDTLSMTQLKQMKNFLENAIKLGYTGYACFKVGASWCSHGMWAHRLESTDGYSPKEGGCLFHSFRYGDNYYGVKFNDGTWADCDKEYTLREVREMLTEKGEL